MERSKSQIARSKRAKMDGIKADQVKRSQCKFANNSLHKGDAIRCYCQHPDGLPNLAVFRDVCPRSKSKKKQAGFWKLVNEIKLLIKMEA